MTAPQPVTSANIPAALKQGRKMPMPVPMSKPKMPMPKSGKGK